VDATLIAVIEMSPSGWLIAGIMPDLGAAEETGDEHALLNLLSR
jgi:hypothetical protein